MKGPVYLLQLVSILYVSLPSNLQNAEEYTAQEVRK